MKNAFLKKQWLKIREQISKLGQVPLAEKILFYKVFIRPLLIFNWVKGRANDLKAVETKALKQIFGEVEQREVYSQYSDIDISCYLKVQECRWARRYSLSRNFLKSKFGATKDFADPFPYFVRALKFPKAKATLRHGRNRVPRRRSPRPSGLPSPVSDETLDSSFVDSLFESTFHSERSIRLSSAISVDTVNQMGPRRSLRLANKNRKFR